MAKKARKKSPVRAKKAKAKVKVRAKAKARTPVRSRAVTKTKAAPKKRKKAVRKVRRRGLSERIESAFHTVVDTVKETQALRAKLEPPGTSETQ